MQLPNFDPIILNFINNNTLTIALVFGLLRGIVKVTVNKWDNAIVDILQGLLFIAKPDQVPPPVEQNPIPTATKAKK